MGVIDTIRGSMGDDWLPSIYRDKIRTQRTRSVKLEIPQRRNPAIVQYTLLGIELKVGKRRFSCPDLSTARYLRVFARFGAIEFAIPYDITRISAAADELESSWRRSLVMVDNELSERPVSERDRFRTRLAATIRDEIAQIGGGDPMPLFDRETRFRNI